MIWYDPIWRFMQYQHFIPTIDATLRFVNTSCITTLNCAFNLIEACMRTHAHYPNVPLDVYHITFPSIKEPPPPPLICHLKYTMPQMSIWIFFKESPLGLLLYPVRTKRTGPVLSGQMINLIEDKTHVYWRQSIACSQLSSEFDSSYSVSMDGDVFVWHCHVGACYLRTLQTSLIDQGSFCSGVFGDNNRIKPTVSVYCNSCTFSFLRSCAWTQAHTYISYSFTKEPNIMK